MKNIVIKTGRTEVSQVQNNNELSSYQLKKRCPVKYLILLCVYSFVTVKRI